MHNLAAEYRDAEKYAQAEPLFTRTIELRRRVLGEENPNTLLSMANLASLYRNQSRYTEAEQLYARVFEVRRRVLGPEHLETMASALGQIRLRNNAMQKLRHCSAKRGTVSGTRIRKPGSGLKPRVSSARALPGNADFPRLRRC